MLFVRDYPGEVGGMWPDRVQSATRLSVRGR